jgi:hypothetical protein
MTETNFGNLLNQIVSNAISTLFRQGELAELTYGAFNIAYKNVQADENDQIQLHLPVGYRADQTTIDSTKNYSKQELLRQYQFLAVNQLAVNGISQLVTTIESMTGDLLRAILMKYPHKIGRDRKISIGDVLAAPTIEAIHAHAVDSFLYGLGYKSPGELAEAVEKLTRLNLMECAAFHRYMEVSATRDIYIHNRGMANTKYIEKSGHHARVKAGHFLPVDVKYFLQSYEQCIQLAEWWEAQLHDIWHSSEYEERKNATDDEATPSPPIDGVSQELRALAAKYSKPQSDVPAE